VAESRGAWDVLFARVVQGAAAVAAADGTSDPGGHVSPENADWPFSLYE